ncbi:D(2) dopamine receptor-like [Haliotis rufescens]|uniref:D(2) dopamine receptor-like n=1 Tax=Haliotis rufescens TaxID=6454 RepID=UPI00201F8E09|nr:D(2) dopamine receptor-like [Haliotis rufescens]
MYSMNGSHGINDWNQTRVAYLTWNLTERNQTQIAEEPSLRWGIFGLLIIILFSAMGNLLVCLAVCWERRLQNMTNYFLMSLAIADFLVSLLVMPLGMIVELYGLFPLDPELCVLWVTSDVLMCTASIWHMCTMSMDRFFTLKYPMRYGRNKTKTMVLMKIFFVWVVSIAVSSPICIHGFIDTSVVYHDGLCVPTLKNFVIYGSIFAFYIPLLIMIATYVLTIRILWKNQRLMKRIERSDMRPRLTHLNQDYNLSIPRLLTSTHDASASRRVSFPDSFKFNTSYLMPPRRSLPKPTQSSSPTQSPEASETEDDELDPKSSTQLLDKRSQSYKSLCRHGEDNLMLRSRSKESIYNPSFEASDEDCTIDKTERKIRCARNFLQVPSLPFSRHGRGQTLYNAVSDTKLDSRSKPSTQPRALFHRSATGLDNSVDYKTREWDKRFFQIQQEMDQCLQDAEKEKFRRTDKPELIFCEDFVRYSLKPLCHSAPNTPLRSGFTSDSGDSLDDKDTKSTSSSSDIITIHLKSPKKSKTSSPKSLTPRSQSPQSPQSPNGGLLRDMISNPPTDLLSPEEEHVMSESADNSAADSDDQQGMRLKQRNKFKKSFRNTLRIKTRPVIKHLLSKKTATNERKASKVLGIIFIVFVFLWTPFFIVNILSVTCEPCMESVTATMMSVFLWMGYAASLANPIIYTMFNTAFRRTFIRILTCKLKRRTSKYAETAFMSYTTMMNTDRRNTMTVLIKDDSR